MENIENSESKQSRGILLTTILIISFIVFGIQSILGLMGMLGSAIGTVIEANIKAESDQFIGPFLYFTVLLISAIVGIVAGAGVMNLKKTRATMFYICSVISIIMFGMLNSNFLTFWTYAYLIFVLTIYISRKKLR